MRKCAWFIGSTILLCVMALSMGGCVGGMSPESEARIEAIKADNAKLFSKLEEVAAKMKTGDISIKEAVEAAALVDAAIKKNSAEIKSITDAEGGTARDAILVGAGIFGRSALHLLTRIPLPAPFGFLAPILTLILQSESKKKQEK